MLPQMRRQPGPAHGPVGPAGIPYSKAHRLRQRPDVAVLPEVPSPPHPIDVAGGGMPRRGQVADKAQQHLMHFGQRRRLGGPIILLKVDVGRIIRAPRRVHRLVPQPLQVRRHALRPR